MASHKSSEKRIRQTTRKTATNRSRESQIKTTIKKVEAAIASGDKAAAKKALQAAQPVLMRGVTKGVLKKETASRKVSRLAARVKSLGATT